MNNPTYPNIVSSRPRHRDREEVVDCGNYDSGHQCDEDCGWQIHARVQQRSEECEDKEVGDPIARPFPTNASQPLICLVKPVESRTKTFPFDFKVKNGRTFLRI